jgi:hypothetical protein
VATGPTTWARIEGWAMAPEDQEKALVATFGKDVFKKATAALRGGKETPGSGSARKDSARRRDQVASPD